MSSFTTHLEAAKGKLGIDFPLKEAQVQALESVYEGKSTICLLPTGFGKSVIYQLTPFLLEHKVQDAVTLVISPLNSIMQDQVRNLARRGVKACYLDMRCQSGETYQFASETSCDTDDSETSFGNDSYSHDDVPEEAPEDALLKVSVPIDAMLSEGYQLIYAHPESFLKSPKGKALIRTRKFRQRVTCIAIDEGHMIAEW